MLKKNQNFSKQISSKPRPCGCGKKPNARVSVAVTRPSCLECVEKHLGAAWVLLAEYREGYPHRLRAVGHLHEAEDESQEWPELHYAIREERKTYQQIGTIPKFELLGNIIENLTIVDRLKNA